MLQEKRYICCTVNIVRRQCMVECGEGVAQPLLQNHLTVGIALGV